MTQKRQFSFILLSSCLLTAVAPLGDTPTALLLKETLRVARSPWGYRHPTAGASLSRHLLQRGGSRMGGYPQGTDCRGNPPKFAEHLPGNFSPQRSGSFWEKTALPPAFSVTVVVKNLNSGDVFFFFCQQFVYFSGVFVCQFLEFVLLIP